MSTRVCADCREEKPLSEFWRKGDGWQSYCKSCAVTRRRTWVKANREQVNAKRRQYHAERMASDPEYHRRHNRNSRAATLRMLTDPVKREQYLESHRQYQRRKRAEDAEAVNEMQRIYYALRQERQGKSVRRLRTVIDGTLPTVPAVPFARWLAEYARATGLGSSFDIAADLGLNERRVRAVLAGEQCNVALDVVDRALLNARCHVDVNGRTIFTLDDLFPIEQEAA